MNTGDRATRGSWHDHVLVRNMTMQQVIADADVAYAESEAGNGPIESHQARARQFTFTLPSVAASFGTFEGVVTANSDAALFEYNAAGTAALNNQARISPVRLS